MGRTLVAVVSPDDDGVDEVVIERWSMLKPNAEEEAGVEACRGEAASPERGARRGCAPIDEGRCTGRGWAEEGWPC